MLLQRQITLDKLWLITIQNTQTPISIAELVERNLQAAISLLAVIQMRLSKKLRRILMLQKIRQRLTKIHRNTLRISIKLLIRQPRLSKRQRRTLLVTRQADLVHHLMAIIQAVAPAVAQLRSQPRQVSSI